VRAYGKLKSVFVNRVEKGSTVAPGKYPDGGGLYLKVAPAGTASWIFRYERDGKRTYMGLGSLRDVGLADARTMAADSRLARASGEDPLSVRDKIRLEPILTLGSVRPMPSPSPTICETVVVSSTRPVRNSPDIGG
jgi:hypothetical protein